MLSIVTNPGPSRVKNTHKTWKKQTYLTSGQFSPISLTIADASAYFESIPWTLFKFSTKNEIFDQLNKICSFIWYLVIFFLPHPKYCHFEALYKKKGIFTPIPGLFSKCSCWRTMNQPAKQLATKLTLGGGFDWATYFSHTWKKIIVCFSDWINNFTNNWLIGKNLSVYKR